MEKEHRRWYEKTSERYEKSPVTPATGQAASRASVNGRRESQVCVRAGVKGTPHMQHAFERRLAFCVQKTRVTYLQLSSKSSIRKSSAAELFHIYPEAGSPIVTRGFSCRNTHFLMYKFENVKSRKLKSLKIKLFI